MGKLRKFLVVLIVAGSALLDNSVLAQSATRVYTDASMRWSQMALNVDRGLVRKGADWRGDVLYTVQGNKIFQGFSSSSFDLAYTYKDGKLYIGEPQFTDAISYTFELGKIYVGDSTFPLDLAYTIRPNPNFRGVLSVYAEESTSPFDIVAFLQGELTEVELLAVLISLALL
tara:strand:- start:170 stop:685 length:516 start_codon:yes stop_codon:yes gene_type:complete